MTAKITIPSTIEGATQTLEGLNSLLTATEWERAAIVYAFTYEGKPGPQIAPKLARSTIRQFARLNLRGLASHTTIEHYRNNWKAAIESGDAEEVQPGDRVTLPEIDWPATRTGTDGYNTPEGAAKTIQRMVKKHGASVVAQAVNTAPAVTMNLIQQHQNRGLTRNLNSKMPKRKDIDPDDQPVQPLTVLELQALITEFHICALDAKSKARKAYDLYQEMQPYLNDEQVSDLGEVAGDPIETWQVVKDFIVEGGVTDEALQNLINQSGGTG